MVMNLWFHKMLQNSWVAEQLAAYHLAGAREGPYNSAIQESIITETTQTIHLFSHIYNF
jgi:hypothetical protein